MHSKIKKNFGNFLIWEFSFKTLHQKKEKKLLAWELAAAVVEGERPEGGPRRLRAPGSELPRRLRLALLLCSVAAARSSQQLLPLRR